MTRHESEAPCDRELSRIILSEFNRVESMLKKQRHPDQVRGTNAKETDPPELQDVTQDSDLLNEEEERFVAETVAWLRPRENKDTVLARIWSSLTEEDPDAFYQPEEKDAQENPATSADVAAEEQNRSEHKENTP